MKDCILTIDQGTTSSRVMAFDAETLNPLFQGSCPVRCSYPQPGWVEQDAHEIWNDLVKLLNHIKDQLIENNFHPRCLGITNQRETVVAWERSSGLPLGPAIVWQDRRTQKKCQSLANELQGEMRIKILKKTGLVVDPYFSASKMSWILEHNSAAQTALKKGDLCLGTIDSFLIYKLTEHRSFATDTTNASRTMLMDLKTLQYDEDLLRGLGVPRSCLPDIRPSIGFLGQATGPVSVPITGTLGDQQAALFGHGGPGPGHAKITYGTGAFLLIDTGSQCPCPDDGLITTVAIHSEKPLPGQTVNVTYAAEGSAFIAGAALDFLKNQMGILPSVSALKDMFDQAGPPGPELFVPSLAGLGAPYWNPQAKGVLWGLHRGSTQAQVVRAVAQGIALQTAQLVTLLGKRGGTGPLSRLNVDGGVTACSPLMQFQADILGIPIARPAFAEMTSWGAARAARAGWNPQWEPWQPSEGQEFIPQMPWQTAQAHLHNWQRAAQAVNDFYDDSAPPHEGAPSC